VRRLALLLAATAALALSACGDSDGGKADGARAGTGVVTELTAAQFAALERANELESCNPLDAADPLLGPIGESCREFTSVQRGMIAATGCKSGRDCKRIFDKMSRRTLQAGTTGHTTDRKIRATGLKDACKHALLTPGSVYRALRQLESALRDAAPRVATGTPDDARLEIGNMAEIADQLPDRGELLAELRTACR